MATHIETYKYKPLAKDADVIRLIRFVDDHTVIIFHVAFSNPPAYRALSYAWGTEMSQQPLVVLASVGNELKVQHLTVTSNCMGALGRLHSDDWSMPVWIDAICIDQNDTEERNHQVSRMAEIYSRAEKVQVDLGPGNNKACEAIEYGRRKYGCTSCHGSPIQCHCTRHTLKDFITPMADIFSRPWFRRLWVLQEIYFARHVEVLCGTEKLPWKCLQYLSIQFHAAPGTSSVSGSGPYLPSVLCIENSVPSRKMLRDWIKETRSLQVSDQRDRVFALLGMASDIQSREITISVDYSKTLVELEILVAEQYALLSLSCAEKQSGMINNVLEARERHKWDDNDVKEETVAHLARLFDQRALLALLDRGDGIEITEKIAQVVATNRPCGEQFMMALLERKDQVKVSEDAIIKIAWRFSAKVLFTLFNQEESKYVVTQKILEVVSSRGFWDWERKYGNKIMKILLDRGVDIKITEELVAQATRWCDQKLVISLLNRRGRIKLTRKIVQAVAANWTFREQIMMALLERKDQVEVSEDAIIMITEIYGEKVVITLLDREEGIKLTGKIIQAVAANRPCGEQIMMALLERKDKVKVSEDGIIEIAQRFSAKVLLTLFDQEGSEHVVTQKVLEAVSSRYFFRWERKYGNKIMKILLDRGVDIKITEELVAQTTRWCDRKLAISLLDRGDGIEITEKIAQAVATNRPCRKQIMMALLERKDKVKVSEVAIVEIAKIYGEKISVTLLDRGEGIKLTEKIEQAVAANRHGNDELRNVMNCGGKHESVSNSHKIEKSSLYMRFKARVRRKGT